MTGREDWMEVKSQEGMKEGMKDVKKEGTCHQGGVAGGGLLFVEAAAPRPTP